MQALRREAWGSFTVTSSRWGKGRRGAEASGVIVVRDPFSAHSLSTLGVPHILLITGPSGASPSGGRDKSVNRTL